MSLLNPDDYRELSEELTKARRQIASLERANSDLIRLLMKRRAEIQELEDAAAETKIGLEIMGTMTQEQM